MNERIYFIGDVGAADFTGEAPLVSAVKRLVADSTVADTLIMLGDNLYPKGLPPEGRKLRPNYEAVLRAQLQVLESFKGRLIYLLGNHDWNKGKANGLQYALAQETFINQFFGRQVVYPKDCSPGPDVVELNNKQVLLLLNTQWWVQPGARSVSAQYQKRSTHAPAFFAAMEELLQTYQTRQVIIVGHHPLLSNAMHGGKFELWQHIFPLRTLHKHFWLPLPGAGSLFPLYRKYIGTREDISHRLYKVFRRQQMELLNRHNGIIYVSGHDHNLQYFRHKYNHFVVSGAGSKIAYVRSGGRSAFVKAAPGFVELLNGARLVFHYFEDMVWQQHAIILDK
jgi:hypothetical protein